MTKWCVIPGQGEYIMGTYPNADRECVNSGGYVEDRGGGGCGSTQAATPPGADGGRAGSSPLAAAAVAPIQALRDRLPESDVLRDLARVNFSPAMLRLLDEDPDVRARSADAVGMVAQFALLGLTDPASPTLSWSAYTEDLHRWLVELADLVRERVRGEDAEELRAAVDRLVEHFERRVGTPVGALVEELAAGTTSTD